MLYVADHEMPKHHGSAFKGYLLTLNTGKLEKAMGILKNLKTLNKFRLFLHISFGCRFSGWENGSVGTEVAGMKEWLSSCCGSWMIMEGPTLDASKSPNDHNSTFG